MNSEFIMQYENIVYKLASKFYSAEREDLIQAGFLGLAKAHKNFNPETGTKFSTYAYEYIYGEMYEVANGTRPIKLRKELMKIYKNVLKTKELLTQKYNRNVSIEEAALFLNLDIRQVNDIFNTLTVKLSIEETELNVSKKENIDELILLKESLQNLTPLERKVIQNRYMEDLSQDETAKKLGLSQVKISRLEKQSKEKIKTFIAS